MLASRQRVTMLLLVTAASLAAVTPVGAQDQECVRVLGYEWSGEKQSMDPASMHSGDDAYHIFAVYNRLVDVEKNSRSFPSSPNPGPCPTTGGPGRKLHDGVKFHSGKPFGVADIVHTLSGS